VLLAVALMLLMLPLWVHTAIDASGGTVPGGTAPDAHRVSDETVRQLVFGGDFAITAPDGSAMYTADEAGHLADVRVVLYLFLALALLSAIALFVGLRRAPRDAQASKAIARGALTLVVLVIGLGVVGLVAFGVAFEIFHRLLFPGGNWAFPPGSNLIALYPIGFWQLSTLAMGGLVLIGCAWVWVVARSRAAAFG
jgi:hypothetical protein